MRHPTKGGSEGPRGFALLCPPEASDSPRGGVEHEDAGGAGDGAARFFGDVHAVRELSGGSGEESGPGERPASPARQKRRAGLPAPPPRAAPGAPPPLTASLMIRVTTALGRFRSSGRSAILRAAPAGSEGGR